MVVVDRSVERGSISKGEPEDGFAGCPDDTFHFQRGRSLENVVGTEGIVFENLGRSVQVFIWYSGHVHDAFAASKQFGDFAQIAKVRQFVGERVLFGARRDGVDIYDVVAMLREFDECCVAGLAGTSCNCDSSHEAKMGEGTWLGKTELATEPSFPFNGLSEPLARATFAVQVLPVSLVAFET